jgi:hypothetical protein
MGRFRDFGWWLRDHAAGFALVLALLGCGAGAAGVVIALDAKDKAEDAAAAGATAPTASVPPVDPEVQGSVDELNERVGAIEESVASLREELETGATTTEDTTTTPGGGGGETTTPPEIPELPEGIDIPGVGQPESEPAP